MYVVLVALWLISVVCLMGDCTVDHNVTICVLIVTALHPMQGCLDSLMSDSAVFFSTFFFSSANKHLTFLLHIVLFHYTR